VSLSLNVVRVPSDARTVVPQTRPSAAGRARCNAHFDALKDPKLPREARIALGQNLLFQSLTGATSGPPPIPIIRALQEVVKQVYPMPALKLGTSEIDREAARRKVLKLRGADVRTVLLGGVGGAIYLAEMGRRLTFLTDDPVVLPLLRREELDGRSQMYRNHEVLLSTDGVSPVERLHAMQYWSPPAIDRDSFQSIRHQQDDLFMAEVVGGLFSARDSLLYGRLGWTSISPEFWAVAREVHLEFREHRRWLLKYGREEGTLPVDTFEESVSGLFCENIVTVLQILNLWIQALLVDLPQSLLPEEQEEFWKRMYSDGAFQRFTLNNSRALFEIPAAGSHSKLRELLGPEPRGPSLIPWIKPLKATLAPLPQRYANYQISASWRIPGMDSAVLQKPGRCTGIPVLSSDSDHFRAIEHSWRAFLHYNRVDPIWEDPNPDRQLNLVEMAAFLAVLSSPRLVHRKGPKGFWSLPKLQEAPLYSVCGATSSYPFTSLGKLLG